MQLFIFFFVIETKSQIIGGSNALDPSKFPHHVSISLEDKDICGGSIIHKYFVLTAAHCLYSNNLQNYKINVGSVFFQQGFYWHTISRIIKHEKFDENIIIHDIGLLKVSSPFVSNSLVKSIDIYDSKISEGMIATVIGWGVDQNDKLQEILQKLQVPILNHAECGKFYKYEVRMTKYHICAGYYTYGSHYVVRSSSGDSGGSLILDEKIVGIVSYGQYDEPNRFKLTCPTIYTAVPMYQEWIKNNIQESLLENQENEISQLH